MITILHGDDIVTSREELQRMLATFTGKDIRHVDGAKLEASQLVQAVESSSLFGGGSVTVIERLFGKLGRKLKLIESYAKIISHASDTQDIVLWEDSALGVSVLKQFPKARIHEFKTPVIIFQLLDGLKPNCANALLPLLARIHSTQAAEITYSLIVRRVRQLIQRLDNVSVEGLAPWQATRLTAQARLFTMDQLVAMHETLLSYDIAIKTGTSPFTLSKLLEQCIISL